MCARIWMTKPGCGNWQAEIMHERIIGTRSAHGGHDLHRKLIDLFSSLDHGSDEAVIWICPSGWFATQEIDLHIAETFCIEMSTQFFENIFRHLPDDESEIHLRRGECRLNRFGAGTLVATGESADCASGCEHFFHLKVCATGQSLDESFCAKASFVFISDIR